MEGLSGGSIMVRGGLVMGAVRVEITGSSWTSSKNIRLELCPVKKISLNCVTLLLRVHRLLEGKIMRTNYPYH